MNVLDAVAAAATVALPAWLAVTVQEPVASKVRVVPFTLQTEGVVEASVTGSPEVELATKAAGVTPLVWLPGAVSVMVCAVGTDTVDAATVKV